MLKASSLPIGPGEGRLEHGRAQKVEKRRSLIYCGINHGTFTKGTSHIIICHGKSSLFGVWGDLIKAGDMLSPRVEDERYKASAKCAY